MSKDPVIQYYTGHSVKEWDRLAKHAYNRLEFDTTMHFLRKYLPEKGCVLDAGGGPGMYTIELAKLGLDPVLLDLTPEMLRIARHQIKEAKVEDRVKQIIEGSVEDLSMFEDNAFDAILCLGGPLNHLVHEERRVKAVDELIRVAKPDAPIFVSVIGRLAVCMNSIVFLWPEMLTARARYISAAL